MEKRAEEKLAAIERNVLVIVLPGRARLAWRIGQLFPALVEKISRDAVAKERLDRV